MYVCDSIECWFELSVGSGNGGWSQSVVWWNDEFW